MSVRDRHRIKTLTSEKCVVVAFFVNRIYSEQNSGSNSSLVLPPNRVRSRWPTSGVRLWKRAIHLDGTLQCGSERGRVSIHPGPSSVFWPQSRGLRWRNKHVTQWTPVRLPLANIINLNQRWFRRHSGFYRPEWKARTQIFMQSNKHGDNGERHGSLRSFCLLNSTFAKSLFGVTYPGCA